MRFRQGGLMKIMWMRSKNKNRSVLLMSELTDKYSKNFSPKKKKIFEKRVFENLGNMSELSAIQLVLAEMRAEGMKDGGMIDKPLGGVKKNEVWRCKTVWPTKEKKGPVNPQGLNIPLKQVKT